MPEPARAVIISAVNTGARLWARATPTANPAQRSCWNICRAMAACSAVTMPVKKPDQQDDGQRAHPDELHLLEEQPRPEGGPEQPGEGVQAQPDVVAEHRQRAQDARNLPADQARPPAGR